MAKEAGVKVHFGARLASVKKNGARVAELVMENGDVFRAKVFMDTSYEGDLMAKAGVTYTLMREGNAKYGETLNGIHYTEKYIPRYEPPQTGAAWPRAGRSGRVISRSIRMWGRG